MRKTYPTYEAAKAEADRLNDARVRTNFEFVATGNREFKDGKMVINGWYVGMCSND